MGLCLLTGRLFWAAALVLQLVYGLPEKKNVTLCEKERLIIECPEGAKIVIADAMYGRMDSDTCVKGMIQDDNCRSQIALPQLSKKCDNQTQCELHASNYCFSDPCIGTSKYLAVNYYCAENFADIVTSKVICESQKEEVDCPEGTTFHVKSATYGRMDNTTCPHQNIHDINCSAEKAYFTLYDRCELKQQCTLEASNEVFGDPCKRTHKYLTVAYTCS